MKRPTLTWRQRDVLVALRNGKRLELGRGCAVLSGGGLRGRRIRKRTVQSLVAERLVRQVGAGFALTPAGAARARESALADVYREDVCRVWLVLDDGPLDAEPFATSREGWPSWLLCDLDGSDWGTVLDYPYEEAKRVQWLCERSLAPGQAFLVEVRPSICTEDRNGDWDVEYRAEVVAVEPLPPEEVAARWEAWLRLGAGPAPVPPSEVKP